MEEFAQQVIEQPEVIESFQEYKRNYESENDISIDDSFAISNYAFKKQQRSYKRVINLDKKIQIIINGNRDHIEQGEDERGKYYKVYYREEEYRKKSHSDSFFENASRFLSNKLPQFFSLKDGNMFGPAQNKPSNALHATY